MATSAYRYDHGRGTNRGTDRGNNLRRSDLTQGPGRRSTPKGAPDEDVYHNYYQDYKGPNPDFKTTAGAVESGAITGGLAAGTSALTAGGTIAPQVVLGAAAVGALTGGFKAGKETKESAEKGRASSRSRSARRDDRAQQRAAKDGAAQLRGEDGGASVMGDDDAMLMGTMYDENAGESQYTKWFRENFI